MRRGMAGKGRGPTPRLGKEENEILEKTHKDVEKLLKK